MAATSCLFLITGECLTDDDIGPLSELIILGVHAWDTSAIGFNLNEELKTFVSSNPSPQTFNADEKGESVIRVFSDNLCVAALINPGLFTLASQFEWLMQTPFVNRHVVFAGRQSEELGDWLLKDASVSPVRLALMLRSAPDASLSPDHKFSITCPVNAAGTAWKSAKPPLTEFRPHAALSELDQSTVPGAVQLAGFIAGKQCGLAGVEQRLRPAGTVGNIRIAKPTLYVFPAGLGDSCYLGVDGFGLLVNTGAGRTPAFWPFLAHLDRVDGLLLSHWDHDNLPGLLALLERLSAKGSGGGAAAPSLGCALLPCRPRADDPDAPAAASSNGGQHHLEASIRRESGAAMRLLRSLGVCIEDVRRIGPPQPMTLYSKLGNGTLDLYPLQPLADSKEFKEFAAQLQAGAGAAAVKPWHQIRVGNSHVNPAHAHSLCCLLVWKPSDPKQAWTRLLLPGCCPQLRVIEGLERIRGLDCLKSPEYSPATAAPAAPAAKKSGAAAPGSKPAPAAAAAASSGDHHQPTAAAKKPAPVVAADTAAAKPAAKKAPPASAPIVKKPVASAADPPAAKGAASGKAAAAPAAKSTTASAKATASVSASSAGAAAKKEPPAAAKGAKAAAAAAPPAKKPPPKSASVKKAEDQAVAAMAPPADEAARVTESAAAGVEEISLGESAAGGVAALAPEGEHQEAWALNTNNTNSADADTGELIAVEGDGAAQAQQPLALPAPPPPQAQQQQPQASKKAPGGSGKPAGTAAATPAVNYGPVHPFYFDLAYVPGHGERQCADAEYFKRVRARYYVLSSCDPQPAVLDALLEGKSAWPDQEATLVPTHTNHLFASWLSANAERMQQLRVMVAPSASNCRIKLQNEEDQICTAYRVEF